MSAGEIARRLGDAPPTFSAYLAQLKRSAPASFGSGAKRCERARIEWRILCKERCREIQKNL